MSTPALACASLASMSAVSMSLSLDDLPDLPGAREAALDDAPDALPAQLLEWSEDFELRGIHPC
ncbi:MAG TPA: hypothetical protein VIN75_16090, partial [Burkholderiaceae bacterium]